MFQLCNKTILAAAMSALTSLMGASAVHAADKAQGEPIVIGVIEDRSGSATFYSQESVKAITLFAESINKGELRSEEHTSELQSLMRISYAVFCLKKKKNTNITQHTTI